MRYILATCKILLVLFVAHSTCWSQKVTATATIEPADIRIGEQTLLTIKAFVPKGKSLQFPVFENRLVVNGIEVLAEFPADTIDDELLQTITKQYVLTSFDSTLYFIPFIPLLTDTDTVKTNSVALKVSSMPLSEQTAKYIGELYKGEVDSLEVPKLGITDIQNIISTKTSWRDYTTLYLIVLGILMIVALSFYLLRKYFLLKRANNKRIIVEEIPPYQEALLALEEINNASLEAKEYFTSINQILKIYLQKQYNIYTAELTSSDILHKLNDRLSTDKQNLLSKIFRVADWVKFAQYTPSETQCSKTMADARQFVETTSHDNTDPDTSTQSDNLS